MKLRRETWFEIMGQDWSVSLKWLVTEVKL